MTTGDRIRKFRLKRNLTQKQLGELCGMSEAMIRQYELGHRNPKYETLEKIANALNVDTFSLIDISKYELTKEEEEELLWQQHQDEEEYQLMIDGYEPVPEPETRIISAFQELNRNGQEKAIEQVELLTEIPKYRKDTTEE